MDVFHIFKIILMVPNSAKQHKFWWIWRMVDQAKLDVIANLSFREILLSYLQI